MLMVIMMTMSVWMTPNVQAATPNATHEFYADMGTSHILMGSVSYYATGDAVGCYIKSEWISWPDLMCGFITATIYDASDNELDDNYAVKFNNGNIAYAGDLADGSYKITMTAITYSYMYGFIPRMQTWSIWVYVG